MRACKHTGGPLPPNLYNDPKGRASIYRYKLPDGRFKSIHEPYAEAVTIAEEANRERVHVPGVRHSLTYWAAEFIAFHESQNPQVAGRRGWRDRSNYVTRFAEKFGHMRTDRIAIRDLAEWWNSLSFDQQHNRRPTLSKFFLYMMANGATPSNPFNTNDHEAHLLLKAKPSKARLPIHEAEFWKVYEVAEPFVRRAMVICLATTLRRADLCALRLDQHIVDGQLRVTVGKSVGQRGFARASHLAWNLEEHDVLRQAVNEAREASLALRRCPYIVAARIADRIKVPESKGHRFAVAPDVLSRGFKRAVDKSELWKGIAEDRRPPSFHEVRGLAIERMIAAGADIRQVQKLAAHTDESITSGYAANHAPEFELVTLATPVSVPA